MLNDFSDHLQEKHQHRREDDDHVEEETSEWEYLLWLLPPIYEVAKVVVSWCSKSRKLLNNVVR